MSTAEGLVASTSTGAVQSESHFQMLARTVRQNRVASACATIAGVMVIAFLAGKANPSQMMLFMVPAAPHTGRAPVVSAKEILTGEQPVSNRVGEPTMETKPDQQIREALGMYDACDSYCCRRNMLMSAVGAAALTIGAPALAAETKTVLMGTDKGELKFVPDELTICKGDSVMWKVNKAQPHNIIFDEDGIPSGVSADSLSKEEYLNAEGDTFKATFTVAGDYKYYCQPHQGAGMIATLTVSA